MTERVLLIGATGLVGKHILQGLESDERVREVVVLARRPRPEAGPKGGPGAGTHPEKTKWLVTDFSDLKALGQDLKVDAVICAMGTTIKVAGSRKAFTKVDLHIPLAVASQAKALGASKFLLVSAAGANARSPFFYNRVKGDLEDMLLVLGFESLVIARPSLLLGEREERRPLERAFQGAAAKVLPMIPAFWRPVHADWVARGLLSQLHEARKGRTILFNRHLHGVVDVRR